MLECQILVFRLFFSSPEHQIYIFKPTQENLVSFFWTLEVWITTFLEYQPRVCFLQGICPKVIFIGSDKIIFQGDLLSELPYLLIKLWVILDLDELLKWSKLFIYCKETLIKSMYLV
jgi:hypothetical protein